MKRLSFKTLLLLACVAACARGAAAQGEPCRLERAVAPDYGGVMLGMTAEELARMFPGSEELQRAATETFAGGERRLVASLGMLELGVRRQQFADAAELVLTFLGGRLHRMDVRYRRQVPWGDVAEFSADASKRLAVPADSWGAVSSDAEKFSRVLDCRGFSVVVRIDRGGPSTLSIVDTAAASSAATPSEKTPGAKEAAPAASPARGRKGRAKGRGGAAARPSPAPPHARRRRSLLKNRVIKTEEEWRRTLTPEQYRVARQKGTERPFSGEYNATREPGTYLCAACGAELFTSEAKFDSHCGWPSFYEPKEGDGVRTELDTSHGMVRTEVLCATCDAHLGHVFDDGPLPTGQRYCINSVVLKHRKPGEESPASEASEAPGDEA